MIELIWSSRCAGCGLAHAGVLCSDCVPHTVHRVPVDHTLLRGAWTTRAYDTGLGRALYRAKYTPDRRLMRMLAQRFSEQVGPALRGGPFSAVVPAPTTARASLRRGFSPAAILAHALGRHLGIPRCDALRVHRGPRQAEQGVRGRRHNLRGRVRSRRSVPGIVLLVDDVITTGATADSAARELLGDASHEVWLATLCAARRHTGTPVQHL